MGIVDIELVKSHLRLDSDAPDTVLVQVYLDAAEEAAIQYLNRSVYATQDEVDTAITNGEDRPLLANAGFTAAVMYAVAAMYYSREDSRAASGQFPQESRQFLDPHRIGQGV